MKYLILSDIHGSLKTLRQALAFYADNQCDMLCILGDILNYGPRNNLPNGLNPQRVAAELNVMADQIIAVRGNCDSEVDQMLLHFPILTDYALVVDEGKKFFLTHGHIYNKVNRPQGKFDAIFAGHTHLWELEVVQDTVFCNTGSITFPKNSNPPTLAVYQDGKIEVYTLDGRLLKQHSF